MTSRPVAGKVKVTTLATAIMLAFMLGTSLTAGTVNSVHGLQENLEADLSNNLLNAAENVNLDAIKSHVKNFTSFGSRVTGYSGYYEATNYIIQELRSYGLEVIVQNYSLAIPLDEGSHILVNSTDTRVKAYSLWPNGIQACQTAPEGISGPLIYVGDGSLSQFNGYEVDGSVVLMDFNSGENWLNAAKLGAKAVIFIAPFETDFIESLKKAIPTPLNFPRLYANLTDSLMLKEIALKGEIVTVHNNMHWKDVVAYNLIASMSGSQYPDDVVVFSANYDSWSSVPAIAPGAEDSLGISCLLELARYLSANRPLRTVWLTAFSGFYEGRAGALEWIEQSIYSPEVLEGRKTIRLQVHLDLSTDSDSMDALFVGPPLWYSSTTYGALKLSGVKTLVENYLELVDRTRVVNTRPLTEPDFVWGTQQPIRDVAWFYYLPTQYTIQTGIVGFTLRTQWAWRLKWWTPLSDEEFIEWENLEPQLEGIFTILTGLATEQQPTIEDMIRYSSPPRLVVQFMTGLFEGFVTMNALIVEYNLTSGWYSPVSEPLVRLTFADPGTPYDSYYKGTASTLSENAYLLWPFNSVYKHADEKGAVTFFGLRPWYSYRLDAWKFDEIDGSITYAPDYGVYGAGAVAGGISLSIPAIVAHPTYVSVPLFECTEVTVFDLIDTNLMTRGEFAESHTPGDLRTYDYETRSVPMFHGRYFAEGYDVGMLFVTRNSRVIITFKEDLTRTGRPILVLTNSTRENPEGNGFLVDKPLTITHTVSKAARDMFFMSSGRYSKLRDKYIRNAGAEALLELGEPYLSKAEAFLHEGIYDKSFQYSLAAVSVVSEAYSDSIMPLYGELSSFILFFASVLVVFSIVFERLLFHSTGKKRIIQLLAILVGSFLILNYVSPAFEVMTNSVINILGVAMALFAAFIIVTFIGETREAMEISAEAKLGRHSIRRGRISALVHLLGVATENLRRRRLSTALTMIGIISFCAAMTAFTSASYVVSVKESPLVEEPPYSGLLLKRVRGWPPNIFDTPIIAYLETFTSDRYTISPRVWLYPASVTSSSGAGRNKLFFATQGGTRERGPMALLGLSDEEAEIFFGEYITGPGFQPHVLHQCLIPESLANFLNVEVGDDIHIENYDWDLKVMGVIANISQTELVDFDSNSLLPLKSEFSSQLARRELVIPPGVPDPMSIDSVLIVPWTAAYNFGGLISSVAVVPRDNVTQAESFELGRNIAFGQDSPVYVGHPEGSATLSKSTSYTVTGWQVMWVLQVIAILSITNFLTGSVQRRRRDIFVYSSVGMDPVGGILMFLAEAVNYAILASVIGYLIGYGMNLLLITMVPTAVFNVSSLFIMISLGAIMLACIGSALYPSLIASRIITPSLERKWKLPSKPKGDLWSIPFPMKFPEEEIMGLLAFLSEYYKGMGSLGHGYRIETEPKSDPEQIALLMDVVLLPAELGLSMKSTCESQFKDVGQYSFHVVLERQTGEQAMWGSRVYPYIDSVRKQLLLWRALPKDQREKYIEIGTSLYRKVSKP